MPPENLVQKNTKVSVRDQLRQLEEHIAEVENQLSSPEVAKDRDRMADLGREHNRLKETIATARKLLGVEERLRQAEELLKTERDADLRELAEAELEETTGEAERLHKELLLQLMPPDPLDERNILLEIRAGTGGEEAALFVADLLRMYLRFAETKGWKVEVLSQNETGLGGFKEVVVLIRGEEVYSLLKHEGGVHRVQRVPETETQGRIHTSAATVAVMPEAEETDVEINESDIRVDTMTSSGPGGQHVNTSHTAIRIVHEPTGIIVQCQDERSQLRNREKAMMELRARLLQAKIEDEMRERAEMRQRMVGSGDRSERIRTWNFPQNRVTDHRINLTLYSLDKVIEGDLEELLEALRAEELSKRMEELTAGS